MKNFSYDFQVKNSTLYYAIFPARETLSLKESRRIWFTFTWKYDLKAQCYY